MSVINNTNEILNILIDLKKTELKEIQTIPDQINKLNVSTNAAILIKKLKIEQKVEFIDKAINLCKENKILLKS